MTALLAVSLLVSCKSGKVATEGRSSVRLAGEAQLAAVIENTPVFDSFSSRLKLTVPVKKSNYTLSGTLKMQRDQLIQISLLVPIIRTEAARIEISPEGVLVIDRLHKRYISVPVSELKDIFHAEIDFPMLQSLFSNAIFLPGKRSLVRKDYASFDVRSQEEDEIELSRQSSEFVYSFLTSAQTNRLLSSSIETHSSKYGLLWKYNDFVEVGGTTFPTQMIVRISEQKKTRQSVMELSRLSVDKQTLTPASIPARYEQVKLSDLFKILEKL